MLHLPILRWGVPYRSVDARGDAALPHARAVRVDEPGQRRPDSPRPADAAGRRARAIGGDSGRRSRRDGRTRRRAFPERHAAARSESSGHGQTPQEYVEQVSATTGMPFSNVRRNMLKVHGVLSQVDEVLAGLTRGLDLSVLDAGIRRRSTARCSASSRAPMRSASCCRATRPACIRCGRRPRCLKMPLVLKPGSAEPWTPLRIINAWVEGRRAGRRVRLLPDRSRRRQRDPALDRPRHGVRRCRLDQALEGRRRVEVHGPGYSKVVIGPDVADDWEQYIDVIAESMSNNGGRSCVNASGVWVTKHADAIAEALATDWRRSRRAPPTIPRRCSRRSRIRTPPSASRRRSIRT